MVPWSVLSVFGFFSVLFCAFTYATTDAMIQRPANPAIPPAMKTGSQIVCSGGSRKISLRLEFNTHIERYACNDANIYYIYTLDILIYLLSLQVRYLVQIL